MIKAKMLVEADETRDNDYDWGDHRCKWHYGLKVGDEVEVNMNIKADSKDVRNTPEGMCYLCKFNGKYAYFPITWLDIDFSEKDIDWEERRYEIAKEAMNAILSNSKWADSHWGRYGVDVIERTMIYTDRLIEQLKRT